MCVCKLERDRAHRIVCFSVVRRAIRTNTLIKSKPSIVYVSCVLYDFFSLTFHQRERLGTSFISICRLNIITNSVFGRYRRGLFFLLHFAKQTLKFSLPQNKLHIFKQKLTRSKGEEKKKRDTSTCRKNFFAVVFCLFKLF